MTFLIQYLIKFSVSLAVLYTFYYVVLRPLTFYQWNRFYLLCYSLLLFILPFINVTPWLPAEKMVSGYFINSMQVVEKITHHSASLNVSKSFLSSVMSGYFTGLLFLTGVLIFVIRVVYQYGSLRAIKRNAVLLKIGEFKFYDVNKPISPFSFANAIFINSRLHTEEEFQRILEHEFVHVKQKHTVDIVIAELVCIVNWFNPFAWLMRKAIRQNLEFIADNNVLKSGIDPRQYQYLLLKVMGIPKYSMANNFSFSSLKKRIAMMNKMKTAKVHLVKFLFVLPLLAIMLLAFRDKINLNYNNVNLTYAGIVMDSENYEPLHNIMIRELNTNTETRTDKNGFFKIRIPVKNDNAELKFQLLKGGSLKKEFNNRWTKFLPLGPQSLLGFISIDKGASGPGNTCEKCFVHQQQVTDKNGLFVKDLSYETVHNKWTDFLKVKKDQEIIQKSTAPVIRIKDQMYVLSGNGMLSWNDGKDKARIYLNGHVTTFENVNASVSRIELKQMDHLNKEAAIKKYGEATIVIDLITYSGVGSDTIPVRQIAPTPFVAPKAVIIQPAPAPVVSPAPVVAPAPIIKVKPAKAPAIPDTIVEVSVIKSNPVNSQGVIDSKPAAVKKLPVIKAGPRAESVPPVVPVRSSGIILREEKQSQNEPLYVVDGKIQSKGKGMSGIIPNAIEEVNIFKGEKVLALYGDKAKNGLVEVKTKDRGSEDKSLPASKVASIVKQLAEFEGVILIDDKEATPQNLVELDPSSIQSLGVLKDVGDTKFSPDKIKDIEAMLKKLPGLQIDKNGNVSAQGEAAKKVLVDGMIIVTTKKLW